MTADVLWSAEWVLPIDAPPLREGAVLVRGERIVEVGPARALARAHPRVDWRHLARTALLPGLVDAHTHLCWSGLECAPPGPGQGFADWLEGMAGRARSADPEGLDAQALQGARAHLARGVTTVADSGPSPGGLEVLRRAGLRGVFGLELFGPDPAQAGAAFAALEAGLARAETGANRHAHEHEREHEARLGVAPHAPYTVSRGLLGRAAALARERGLSLLVHLAESREELEYLRAAAGPLAERLRRRGIEVEPSGLGPAAWLESAGALRAGDVLAHCVHAGPDDLARIARAGAGVALCPTSNEVLGVGPAPLRELLAAGVPLGVGTDSAATNPARDPFQELRALLDLARAQEAPFGPGEALRAATLGGARLLGLERQVGSLTPGKLADLVAVGLDGEPGEPAAALVRAGSAERVRLVIRGGEPLCRPATGTAPGRAW